MKILMKPGKAEVSLTHGIGQVIHHWTDTLTKMGVEFVAPNAASYDLVVSHAGKTNGQCDIACNHGLYWTSDYNASENEYITNAGVIADIRHARAVTVPSAWVAEAFQRDMRFTPHVIPHGINWREWESKDDEGYVLFNKNRAADVCYPEAVGVLASHAPSKHFVTTFAPKGSFPNVHVTGVVPHEKMKELIQRCGVYLATTKETFGIGTLEAMASGKPILGFAHGGILDLVEHGVNGYLAQPGNYDELVEGLGYCLSHAKTLGANSREMAKHWTWEAACKKLLQVFEQALVEELPTVGIVIPTYNYGTSVGHAIESAIAQTYPHLTSIIVVDDGTQDGGLTESNVKSLAAKDKRVRYIKQPNRGVAVARNKGIANLNTKYVCCLDADDTMMPEFLNRLVTVLESDRSLGLVYSNLYMIWHDGRRREGRWPGECNFDEQLKGNNQVPTCCVFRREAWKRLGGYRQRYAPKGCGSEDAEFWTRMGAYGWGLIRGTDERLFLYTLGGNTTGNKNYEEPNWTAWHPWTVDKQHPFASIATPKNHSHPVRQYDEPTISIVIPVGPGHGKHVVDALDSLEAQTFRKWEAIVVWDNAEKGVLKVLQTAYPYVKWVVTDGGNGAGRARNLGVQKARGHFLLFLDADDWLLPTFMTAVLQRFDEMETDAGIYTDHFGILTIDNPTALSPTLQRSIREWNGKEAIIEYHPPDYNWEKAAKQPSVKEGNELIWLDDPYIWNTITTLIPTTWFQEVGGFDEEMESWEDWDFWLRLAREGKCFAKVSEPLMVYRLHAGFRREAAKSDDGKWLRLAGHMHNKYVKLGEPKMCVGCKGKNRGRTPMMPQSYGQTANMPQARPVNRQHESNMILVRYIEPRRGQHGIVGAATKRLYGYRDYGDVFEIDLADYELAKHWFQPVSISTQPENPQQVTVRLPQTKLSELPPPPQALRNIEVSRAEEVAVADAIPEKPVRAESSLAQAVEAIMGASHMAEIIPVASQPILEPVPVAGQVVSTSEPAPTVELGTANNMLDLSIETLPGMTFTIAEQFQQAGYTKIAQIANWDVDMLQEVKGVGVVKAQKIRSALDMLARAK